MTADAAPDPPVAYRQRRFRRPPGSTELLLVRHGETEPAVPGSPFPLVDGHGDPALAPEGQEQARLVADRLVGEGLTALYVSTLRRTHETAAPLAEKLGLVPLVEPDLREVHLGEFEGGVYRQRAAEGHPAFAEMYRTQRWDAIPGAEDHDALVARVVGAIGRIAERHPDGRVGLVTHGGVIGAAVAHAVDARGLAFTGADNGSVTHLVVTSRRWVVRRYNDTGHLGVGFDAAPDPPA